jgi:hypothetical protein
VRRIFENIYQDAWEAVFHARVAVSAIHVASRIALRRRVRYTWFRGIADWKVNAMAREELCHTPKSEVEDILNLVILAARAERNRRYPARVGLPRSVAVRWE